MIRRYGTAALALFILYLIVLMDERNQPQQFIQQYECGDDSHNDSRPYQAVANGCSRVQWERKL